jgi:hypothetical protein
LKELPIGTGANVDPNAPQQADFGCPNNASCASACRAMRCSGGYCGSWLWLTCWCLC